VDAEPDVADAGETLARADSVPTWADLGSVRGGQHFLDRQGAVAVDENDVDERSADVEARA
jgi:hypothetical protein